MKKLIAIIMTFAMCFAFVPFMDEANYTASAETALTAPQTPIINLTPYLDAPATVEVTVPTTSQVLDLVKKDNVVVYLQLDWKLDGEGITDDWKYAPAWDTAVNSVEGSYWEKVDYAIGEGEESLSLTLFDYEVSMDENSEAEPREWQYIVPKESLTKINVGGEDTIGINYNRYALKTRARYVEMIETYDEDTGEYSYAYSYSPWSEVASYGNFSADYAAIDNLLVNPDFEEGLTGWKNPDGAWCVLFEESGYYPQHGRFLAWPRFTEKTDQSDRGKSYIYQDIPLNAGDIGKTFVFNTLLCNFDQGDCDMGKIKVKYMDANGKAIKEYTQDQRNPHWNSQSVISTIPKGAVKARIMLYAIRYVGSDIDAYYDYSSAYISDTPIFPVKIKESESRRKAKAGDVLKLTASNGQTENPADYVWSSSFNKGATVDKNGVVTMHTDCEDGVAIYAKDTNGVTGVYWINSEECLGEVKISSSSYAYTGAAKKPAVTVVDGAGRTLKKDADYTVSYKNNVNVGTATITVTGLGMYEDQTLTKKFKITAASIEKFSAKVEYAGTVYSGSAKKPAVTLKNAAGDKLKKDTDYTVSYKNNKDVGKATVTITGKGSYKGTIKKTFKINPKGTTISSLTAAGKGFTVKYKKQATQTTGYQIRYSTKSSMASTKTVTVNSNKTLSAKVTNLAAKTKYYVQVRTYKTVNKTKYYSDWSKLKDVKTKK